MSISSRDENVILESWSQSFLMNLRELIQRFHGVTLKRCEILLRTDMV